MAILSFNGELDTSKWKLVNNKQLIFTDMKGPEAGDSTVAMDIEQLTDTLLEVRMTKDIDTSFIFFKRESKK